MRCGVSEGVNEQRKAAAMETQFSRGTPTSGPWSVCFTSLFGGLRRPHSRVRYGWQETTLTCDLEIRILTVRPDVGKAGVSCVYIRGISSTRVGHKNHGMEPSRQMIE